MNFECICDYVMNNLLEILSVIVSFVALAVSYNANKKQRTLQKQINLYDKREEILFKTINDEFVNYDAVEIYFPCLLNKFEELRQTKSEIQKEEIVKEKYLEILSHNSGELMHEIENDFNNRKMQAEANKDDSYEKYCQSKIVSFVFDFPFYKKETIAVNYFELENKLNELYEKRDKQKEKLIKKMKKTLKKISK